MAFGLYINLISYFMFSNLFRQSRLHTFASQSVANTTLKQLVGAHFFYFRFYSNFFLLHLTKTDRLINKIFTSDSYYRRFEKPHFALC